MNIITSAQKCTVNKLQYPAHCLNRLPSKISLLKKAQGSQQQALSTCYADSTVQNCWKRDESGMKWHTEVVKGVNRTNSPWEKRLQSPGK